ncbi:hypothetical protein PYW08_000100 [Mythimna loreyi]|uniref:Uncharacterized protein n=1 Tax=Mythimna loreyi TaxID=667449 RepID=A0ACC2R9T9_9NEOP|nr:hypothetical protein PYW08_000100 [Mythimna loreyi]
MRQGVGWGRLPSVSLSIRRYSTVKKLFQSRHEKYVDRTNKVTVVGVGQVGMATIFALLTQNVSNNIVMVDTNEKKMKGEAMDLQHASSFLYNGNANIDFCTDYTKTKDSSVCVIAAGVRQEVGEDRLSLVERNVEELKGIVPKLVKHSPRTIIIIASNPVDVLTYVTWKLSGLQKNRVIGSGTNLDSGRFRYLLSRKLNIAPFSCHAYIIGEHGDSCVPVWSSVNIAGVRLQDVNKNIGKDGDDENWKETHTQVVQSAYTIIKLKGYTSWAIGLSISQIVKAVLTNSTRVHAVTTCVQGEHGVADEVFLSLPCVLGRSGVQDIIRQPLSHSERNLFHKSAAIMTDIQCRLQL